MSIFYHKPYIPLQLQRNQRWGGCRRCNQFYERKVIGLTPSDRRETRISVTVGRVTSLKRKTHLTVKGARDGKRGCCSPGCSHVLGLTRTINLLKEKCLVMFVARIHFSGNLRQEKS